MRYDANGNLDDNYQYDEIGNLIKDGKEGIDTIEWTVYGKISKIVKGSMEIRYSYDATGNRISKEVDPAVGATQKTYYVRDGSGNVMSVYEEGGELNEGNLSQSEVHLYGSSRLGIFKRAIDMTGLIAVPDGVFGYERGHKFFELSNHLGNVLVTVTDRKNGVAQSVDTTLVDYYLPDMASASDYYPFGMTMPGRKLDSDKYRYGFNGQEKSTEIDPNGNSMSAEFWQYDARLGRRWNVDPVFKEQESPYACFGGSPISFADPYGLDSEGRPNRGEYRRAAKYAKRNKIKDYQIKELPNGSGVSLGYINRDGVAVSRRFLKTKYSPESDFMTNPLTGYNSKVGPDYIVTDKATTESLLKDWLRNYQSSTGRGLNTMIVGGALLDEVKNLESVQRLFRQGIGALINANQQFTPGTSFTGHYRMGNLESEDGQRMRSQVIKDLLDGKSLNDSRLLSAEFFLGSFGFSMRVTNDGNYMVMTVYDSKTAMSATDGGNRVLKKLFPTDKEISSTYQRYFWAIPINKILDSYKESIISSYKSIE